MVKDESGSDIRDDRLSFASVPNPTLPERVSRQLLVGILRGDIKSEAPLPSEGQLARDFGVSRPVVREAVNHLGALGLVRSRQGRQSRVAPYDHWNQFAPDLLAARRDSGIVEDVLLELLELRRMIEVEAAAIAAARASEDDLVHMGSALAELETALPDPRRFAVADIAYHRTILAATRNHLLPRLFDSVGPLLEFGREISATTRKEGPMVSQAGHRAIYDAISSGLIAEARSAMERHLSWTANLDFDEREVRLALERARGAEDVGAT